VLCPSFYRTELISNPTTAERWRSRIQRGMIGFLQRGIDRRLAAILG
jgi:indolepyruvate ferredoxin oxidoreductase alpha subunit